MPTININVEREKTALLYKIIFLTVMMSFLLLYRVASSEYVDPVGLPLFLVLAVLIGVAVIAIPEARTQPFSAFSYSAILWLMGYVYRGVVVSTEQGGVVTYWGTPEDHLVEGAWLCILGYFCFFIGYRSRIGPAIGRFWPYVAFPSWQTLTPGKLMFKLYIFYGIGWLGRLLLFSVGIFHRQQEILVDISMRTWFNMLAQMAIYSIWAIFAIKNSKSHRFVTFLPWFIIEFVYGMIEGSRTVMVMAALIYFFTRRLYGPRAFKWSNVILLRSISYLTIFPALSFVRQTYYKAQDQSGQQGVDTAIDSVGRWGEEAGETRFSDLQQGIALRFAYLDNLLIVLDRVPSVYPYQHGDTFVSNVIFAPVPRIFWKNKPVFNSGRRWAILFHDDRNEGEIGTYTSIGIIAEAFFNFGHVGVLMMFIIGVWLRIHWTRFTKYKGVDPVSPVRLPFIMTLTSPVLHITSVFSGIWRATFDVYFFIILLFGVPRIVTWRSKMLNRDE